MYIISILTLREDLVHEHIGFYVKKKYVEVIQMTQL